MVKVFGKKPVSRLGETARIAKSRNTTEGSANSKAEPSTGNQHQLLDLAIAKVLQKNLSTNERMEEAMRLIIKQDPVFKLLSAEKQQLLIEKLVTDVGTSIEMVAYVDALTQRIKG